MTANCNFLGATKSEKSGSRNHAVELSVLDAYEDKVIMSQIVCEPALGLEECDPPEAVEEPRAVSPPTYPPTTCPTGQTATCPSAQPTTIPTSDPPVQPADSAQPSEPQPEWTVGAPCQAVWSEDGRVYTATILSLDGERCRVRFDGYGNEDEVDLSSLKQPAGQSKSTQEWKEGSPCRARYSVDGLTYPAVVLWVRGQRCRVRFNHYNNEEELDVDSLLSSNELHGPMRSRRGATRRPVFTGARRSREASDSVDKKEPERGEREEKVERERDGSWKDPQETRQPRHREEREAEEKKPADPPLYPLFSPFPPFPPPPPPQCYGDVPGSVPPPFGSFGGRDLSAALAQTSQMLMLWYMCGFYTGSYLAQQQLKPPTRD